MTKQRTFILIKPDGMPNKEKVFEILDKAASRVAYAELDEMSAENVAKHYEPHKDKPFFQSLVNEFAGQATAIAVYEGEDVIARIADIVGETEPTKARQGTIRATFSKDSKEAANRDKRYLRNVLHRSDSVEEAEREISVWAEFLFSD